jgi:tRNA pseudouridine55 synthase
LSEPFGFLNVDKPLHLTSHDVVAKLRRALKLKRIGHAGTLDPLATGVLVVCVGAATRLSEYVMQSTKRYVARVYLGVTTETYDAEGAPLETRDASHITRDDVEHALTAFVGEIDQLPPMYSAIKQGGRKLYELARAGETVERTARRVRIDSLTLNEWSPPLFSLEVTCSAGTYIRSLAYDIGEVLGVGAHLAGLVRSASGGFTLDDAAPLDALMAGDWQTRLISPAAALPDWPDFSLSAEALAHVRQGRAVTLDASMSDGTLALAYSPEGTFTAILRADGGLWKPHKVFSAGE